MERFVAMCGVSHNDSHTMESWFRPVKVSGERRRRQRSAYARRGLARAAQLTRDFGVALEPETQCALGWIETCTCENIVQVPIVETDVDDDRLVELKENFDHFDRDSNGRLDFAEFAALMDALEAGLDRRELEIGFNSIDRDGSGGIDFAEFEVWWSAR